jgi:heat shock protein HslJ
MRPDRAQQPIERLIMFRIGSVLTRYLAIAAVLGLVGAGCGGGGAIEGRDWVATALEGDPVPAGVSAGFTFDGETISGSSGCNTFNGPLQVDGDAFAIGAQMATTLRACGDPADQFELRYLRALQNAIRVEVSGENLSLFGPDGSVLLEFAEAS